MDASEYMTELSDCIAHAVRQRVDLLDRNPAWRQEGDLTFPILRIQASLEGDYVDVGNPFHSQQVASITLDLADIIASNTSQSETSNALRNSEVVQYDEEEEVHSASAISLPSHRGHIRSSNLRYGSSSARPIATYQGRFAEKTSRRPHQKQTQTRDVLLRKNYKPEQLIFQPSSLDKLIIGVWEQIHQCSNQDFEMIFESFDLKQAGSNSESLRQALAATLEYEAVSIPVHSSPQFKEMNILCRKVTQESQACRSIEIIVQARWTEVYEEQIQQRILLHPDVCISKHRKAAIVEACRDFNWSEKELRNRMAIWRGYKEIKDAAGWAALVFAGIGIYRYCKYRVKFDHVAEKRLRSLRSRFEVAADTLHPGWRRLLPIVGEFAEPQYKGGPHDWVVFEDGTAPIPLTRLHLAFAPATSNPKQVSHPFLDENVSDFENSEDSEDSDDEGSQRIDKTGCALKCYSAYCCSVCGQPQSNESLSNSCSCFSQYFGCVKRKPAPVQICCASEGQQPRLLALMSFDYNAVVGEYTVLTTIEVENWGNGGDFAAPCGGSISQTPASHYAGFAKHSDNPNATFCCFTWIGEERTILISKGISAGEEITINYGDTCNMKPHRASSRNKESIYRYIRRL